jgi:hypothetical protein
MKRLDLTEITGDETLVFADGFDRAIIGTFWDWSQGEGVCRVVYSEDKCIAILMERDGMEFDEAAEFLAFNVTDVVTGFAGADPIFISNHPLAVSLSWEGDE